MSAGRAWVLRDLGERAAAARAVRGTARSGPGPGDGVLRNPGPRATGLPGRLARTSGHAVARVLTDGAHAVATQVAHAAHRVARLVTVRHTGHVVVNRWHH